MIVHRIDTQADLDPVEVKQGVKMLEKILEPMPQVECPVINVFAEGIYSRQCFNPKGTFIIGKEQKFGCLVVLLSGQVRIFDANGVREVTAPAVFPSEPGAKRCVYAVEDSIFMTVHANPENETDLDKIEDRLIVRESLNMEDQNALSLREAS